MATVQAILDAYVAGQRSRLDPMAEVQVTDWEEVEGLLAGFVAGDRSDDAHLRHFSLMPLEKAHVDQARLAKAVVALLPTTRDTEDLMRVLADRPTAIDELGVLALVDHCRRAFDETGVASVWEHRYAFETVARCDQAPKVVLPWLVALVHAMLDQPETGEAYVHYDVVAQACAAFARHPGHLGDTRRALARALQSGIDDVVRAAGTALHALIGSDAYLAAALPLIEEACPRCPAVDEGNPATLVEPLIKARADWFDALILLVDSPHAFAVLDSGPRLLRRIGLTEDRRTRLAALVTASNKETAAVARQLLAAVEPAARATVVRFDRLAGHIPHNPYLREPIAVVDGDRVWIPLVEVLTAAPPGEWSTDADRFALVSFDPSDAGNDRYYPLPLDLPIQPTGAQGDKRLLTVVGVAGSAVFASLRQPFADDRGWGSENYLLRLDATTGAWALLHGDGLVDLPSQLEREHAWCGGELVAWLERSGTLHTAADSTPYFLDGYEQHPATKAARATQREARQAFALGDGAHGLTEKILAALRHEGDVRFGLDDPTWEVVDQGELGGRVVLLADAADPDDAEVHHGTFLAVFAAEAPKRAR